MSEKKPAAAPAEVEETTAAREPEANAADQGTSELPVAVCSPSGLNLRTGPGLSYPAAFVLEDGTEVEPLDLPAAKAAPGWVPVLAGLRLGWVDGRFLQGLEF